MAKKLFLNRDKFIPTIQATSVSGEEHQSEGAFSGRNNPVPGITEQLPFLILD
jgi:hypothetical protein